VRRTRKVNKDIAKKNRTSPTMNLSSKVPFSSHSVQNSRKQVHHKQFLLYNVLRLLLHHSLFEVFEREEEPIPVSFTRAFILRFVERTGRLFPSAHLHNNNTCHSCYTTVPVLLTSLINEQI
jgi:hypothetical protein